MILRGIFHDYVGTALVTILGLLAIPVYFQFITQTEYGLWLVVNSVLMFLVLFDLGTDQYLTTITSKDVIFNSKYFGSYLGVVVLIKTISALCISIIGLVIYFYGSKLLNIDNQFQKEIKYTFTLGVISQIIIIIGNTFPTILYARNNYSFVNNVININAILTIALTLVFLKLNYGIVAFPLAIILGNVIQFTIFIIALIKINNITNFKFNLKEFLKILRSKAIFQYSINFQLLKCVYTFRSQYIPVAIANFIGPMYVTQYLLSCRGSQIGTMLSAKFANAFFPFFSANTKSQRGLEKCQNIFIRNTKILTRAAIFNCLVLYSINESFISIWVGSDKYIGHAVNVLIILMSYIYVSTAQFAIVIFSLGKFGKWAVWGIFEITLTLICIYFLSKHYGLFGIILSFCIASIPTQIYLLKLTAAELKLSKIDIIVKTIKYAVSKNLITASLVTAMTILEIMPKNLYEIIGWVIILCFSNLISEGYRYFKSKKNDVREKLLDAINLPVNHE